MNNINDNYIDFANDSRIMNEDVLIAILQNFQIKQLIKIERTTKQLCFCVKNVLKRRKFLKIGETSQPFLCYNENHRSEELYELSELTFDSFPKSIVHKLSNIRCLYLNQWLELRTILLKMK